MGFGGELPSTVALVASGSLTAQTSSTCAAASCLTLPSNALVGSVGWQITGTFVGTVTFEGSVDGINFTGVGVFPPVTSGSSRVYQATATAPGVFIQPVVGMATVRARCSAYTSGTIVVTGRRNGLTP
jgi:hypothetical protein